MVSDNGAMIPAGVIMATVEEPCVTLTTAAIINDNKSILIPDPAKIENKWVVHEKMVFELCHGSK